MIAAGHYLAAHAGFEILEAGGNAIDAGVGAGIALGVVQSELVNFAGVAPIMIYLADSREVMTLGGLGPWPRALAPDLFQRQHGGRIPEGILRVVVPAAPEAWITALQRWGTMSFADVAGAATRFAGDGFVMYPLMAGLIADNAESYARWPGNAAIYLPGGAPPTVGSLFRQTDLARTLQYMADQERATARKGRATGLRAARDAFYRGDIAAEIVRFHEQNDGLLRAEDLAEFEVGIEPAVRTGFAGATVFACGPWCQGPVLLQALNLLEGFDLAAAGHNSADYIHRLCEALKLAFADRHHHYGDPRFVSVPIEALLSEAYAVERRRLIDPDRAWPDMPPAGDPPHAVTGDDATTITANAPISALDTSYVAVVDRHGNAFSATPSDTAHDAPVVPGTGLCPSSRGKQSWADPAHPSGVAPGKRPRLTPNPALAIRDGAWVMPFGTPGGDVQPQAMLQTFLNVAVFGMEPQAAVEAPRFATASFPSSFEPHGHAPGRLDLEGLIPERTAASLRARGHDVNRWPDRHAKAGAICLIQSDPATGIHAAGADHRRPCYALGW
jgi:gamma-glutamyltranspeptidase/glutathione hydrolase